VTCVLLSSQAPICNDGATIVAAVADSYPLEFALTSTRSAYDPTNASVCANNACEKRKGSKHGSLRNAVPSAELDTSINDLRERQRHRVKLHKPPRRAIRRSDDETDVGGYFCPA
jgi:hypothetical protein